MNLHHLATKIRVKAHCLSKNQALSIKGEYVLEYMDRVLNGEISEKNRVQDYEDIIEWYIKEDGSDRETACKELREVLGEMVRPWKEE